MAKLRISGDSSGYVDLEAPNAASSSTLDLDQVPQKNAANVFSANNTFSSNSYFGSEGVRLSTDGSGELGVGYGHTATTKRFSVYNGTSNRFSISPEGYVTTPQQPSFRVRVSQGYSGNNIVITFADIQHNIGNHYSSASGTFTAPVSGSYFFGYQGISASGSTTNEQNMILVLNGGVPICDSRGLGYSQSSIHIKTVIYLSANDTVLVKTGNANTSTYNGGFHSQFFGYLIG